MDDYREPLQDPGDWVPRGGYEQVHHDPPSSPLSGGDRVPADAEPVADAGTTVDADAGVGDGDAETVVADSGTELEPVVDAADAAAGTGAVADADATIDVDADTDTGAAADADAGTTVGANAGAGDGHADVTVDADVEAGANTNSDTGAAADADPAANANTATDTETGSDTDADAAASVDADASAGVDPVVAGLRSGLDAVVDSSRRIASAEAARSRDLYAMLQDALDHPSVFVPGPDTLSRADLTGETEGWVRSSVAQEIGAAIGVTKNRAAVMIRDAEALCELLPDTLEALSTGEITGQHVNAMIRHATGLTNEDAAVFEARALPKARVQSSTQFAHAAIKIREGLFPDTIEQRRADAVTKRRVDCSGLEDGMGRLSIDAPIEVVKSLANAATQTARALKAAGDDRTQTQIEADALIDAIMIGFTTNTGAGNDTGTDTGAGAGVGSPGVGAAGIGADRLGGIRPTVHVTVPVMTLLGKSSEPGHLDGYGPIAPSVARELAARAPSFIRLLTHPETGAVLSVGRDSYKVPTDLKRAIQLRDETCVGIGCNKPATICDLDHVLEWEKGGETKLSNNAAECKQHHMIRHHTTWQIRLTNNQQVEWVSPLGYTYRVPRTSNIQFADTAPVDDSAADDAGDDAETANLAEEFPDTPPF